MSWQTTPTIYPLGADPENDATDRGFTGYYTSAVLEIGPGSGSVDLEALWSDGNWYPFETFTADPARISSQIIETLGHAIRVNPTSASFRWTQR